MNILIESSINTLKKAQLVLDNISDKELSDATVSPYYSSIGTHIRHILDFYDCIFNLNAENKVDLTARSRNKDVECDCGCAQDYLNLIMNKVSSTTFNINDIVIIIDDLGLGKTEVPYTYGSLLAQANSHTIHHYAIINYIFDSLGIVINDSEFGYNPTTPKQVSAN